MQQTMYLFEYNVKRSGLLRHEFEYIFVFVVVDSFPVDLVHSRGQLHPQLLIGVVLNGRDDGVLTASVHNHGETQRPLIEGDFIESLLLIVFGICLDDLALRDSLLFEEGDDFAFRHLFGLGFSD